MKHLDKYILNNFIVKFLLTMVGLLVIIILIDVIDHLNKFIDAKIPQSEIDQRVKNILDLVQLGTFSKRKPDRLSGGEKQRVSVMRAIINKPSIILADEPTGNLDERNALKMIDLFKKLNKDFNLTFVIATHDNKVFEIGHQKMSLSDGLLLNL